MFSSQWYVWSNIRASLQLLSGTETVNLVLIQRNWSVPCFGIRGSKHEPVCYTSDPDLYFRVKVALKRRDSEKQNSSVSSKAAEVAKLFTPH